MNDSTTIKTDTFKTAHYARVLAVVWTVVVSAALVWNVDHVQQEALETARIQARVAYDQNVIYRYWNAKHDGVYVPVTDETPPNPYLSDHPDRDIVTSSGTSLTLMNPAYMTRQIHELMKEESGVLGHLTSLNPIRSENAPDPWETRALRAFERGQSEMSAVEEIANEEYMRLMRPLITEKDCLTCHAKQGYEEGDIRGGMSISIPMEPLWAISRMNLSRLAWGHALLWLMGMGGIVLGAVRLNRSERTRTRAEEALHKARDELEIRVRERTAELVTVNDALQAEIAERRRLVAILEATSDFVGFADPQGRVIYVNPAGRRMVGIGDDEAVVGLSLADFHPEWALDIFAREGFPAATRDGTWIGEAVFTHRDGHEIPVSQVLIVHKTPEGTEEFHSTIARDITERKQAEERLNLTLRELERSNADLQQFAYVASHDLQEPLRAVSGCVQILQQRYHDRFDDAAEELMTHAVDGATRLQGLIDDLLMYSRVSTRGKAFEPVESKAVLEIALANLNGAVQEKGAVITHDPMPVVQADETQLLQVFQNLIGNAIKFRTDAPPRIHISVEHIEDAWRFAVQDNGIGIDPQYFDRIFDIFQRLHTRRTYGGTGMGLAICKKIVERHGGRLWIESTPGRGSTFFFTIPEREDMNDEP